MESKYAITESASCNPYMIGMIWDCLPEDIYSKDLFWAYKIEDINDPKVWIKVAKSKSVEAFGDRLANKSPMIFGVNKDWYIAAYSDDMPFNKRKEMFNWFLSQKESK